MLMSMMHLKSVCDGFAGCTCEEHSAHIPAFCGFAFRACDCVKICCYVVCFVCVFVCIRIPALSSQGVIRSDRRLAVDDGGMVAGASSAWV